VKRSQQILSRPLTYVNVNALVSFRRFTRSPFRSIGIWVIKWEEYESGIEEMRKIGKPKEKTASKIYRRIWEDNII
jgi:hypothetical protein